MDLLDEFTFLVGVVKSAQQGIEIVVLPILVGGFCSLDLLICLQLVLMVLQVPASDDIVISETGGSHLFNLLFLFLLRFRTLFWCGKVMLCKGQVRKYIVIGVGFGSGPEVPWLFFGVVGTVL